MHTFAIKKYRNKNINRVFVDSFPNTYQIVCFVLIKPFYRIFYLRKKQIDKTAIKTARKSADNIKRCGKLMDALRLLLF